MFKTYAEVMQKFAVDYPSKSNLKNVEKMNVQLLGHNIEIVNNVLHLGA